jgi:pimeloyl-ACP methyl ester carboxylesterase
MMETFADDLAWTCARLGFERPLVVGHSLGGLVALQFAVACPDRVAGVVLIDSVLLAQGDRAGFVRELVAGLRGPDAEQALRAYFGTFFAPRDDPARKRWILDEAARTAPHVIASAWEETTFGWDDAEALRACRAPLLYLDAGTPNADLPRAAALHADLALGRTVGSGHFSPLEVPEQVNAMLDRFLAVGLPVPPR